MTEQWMLVRGQHDPNVWPFQTRELAEDFALEHGLIDWRPVRSDDEEKEHEGICARCRTPWPCEHVRVEGHARAIERASANRCARCGKQVGWMKVRFPGAGDFGLDVIYHGKLGACYRDAVRRAEATGCETARKDIELCEKQREYGRSLKAMAQQRREAMARRVLDATAMPSNQREDA